MLDLTPIKARERAATKGPWMWAKKYEMRHGRWHWCIESPESAAEGRCVGPLVVLDAWTSPHDWSFDPDAQFVSNARQDIPALIAEVERLRGLLGACREHIKNRGFWNAPHGDELCARIDASLENGK